MRDVFSRETARKMAEEALDYYHDELAQRFEDYIREHGTISEDDVGCLVDDLILESEMLPCDQYFAEEFAKAVWRSGLAHGIAEDLRERGVGSLLDLLTRKGW